MLLRTPQGLRKGSWEEEGQGQEPGPQCCPLMCHRPEEGGQGSVLPLRCRTTPSAGTPQWVGILSTRCLEERGAPPVAVLAGPVVFRLCSGRGDKRRAMEDQPVFCCPDSSADTHTEEQELGLGEAVSTSLLQLPRRGARICDAQTVGCGFTE